MLIPISKTVAVNPKHVMFIGDSNGHNDEGEKIVQTTVFIVGCPKGLASEHNFEATLKLLNGESV